MGQRGSRPRKEPRRAGVHGSEIAVALITGERGGISEELNGAMRDSGLAHVLSLIAMPFGLEAWPPRAMGFGIELMVGVGQWVAASPGAVSVLPAISGPALVLMVLGGLWLCLWRTRTRALGLVIAALGLALAPGGQRPDVLIERNGETAALRSEAGNLVFPPATAASYSVDNWLLPTATIATSPRRVPLAPFAAILSAASARSRAREWR